MKAATTLLKTFIVGSSYPVMVIPLMYLGIPHMIATEITGKAPFHGYELVPLLLPLYYGFMTVLIQTVGKLFIKNDFMRLAVFGGLTGVLLSFYGRFETKYPKKVFRHVFDYPENMEWMVHILAFLVYAFEYGVVIYSLLHLFDLF